jgi:hypothetical protein
MTLNLTNTLKRKSEPCDFIASPQKRRKRVESSSNLSSSIERPSNQTELEDRVQLHGGERIQTLGTLFHAYHMKGVRSDGTLRDIKVKVGSAKMQVGKGTRREHAAHSNPCSGVRDNYFKLVARDLKNEKKITPITAKVLSRALNPDVWKVVKSLDLSDPDCDVAKYIPTSSSLIDNSKLALLLNGTHVLPADVNLQVDCPLEKAIRPKEAEWLEKVCINASTPKEALAQSKEAIEEFFKSQIEKLKHEKVIKFTELELQGTQAQDLDQLEQYLFDEFKDGNGEVDFDKTLRLLEYQNF